MRWTSRGQIIHAEKSRPFAEVDRNRPPTAIKVATRSVSDGEQPGAARAALGDVAVLRD